MKQTNNAIYSVLLRPCLHKGHTLGETAFPLHVTLHSPAELKLLNGKSHDVRGEKNRRKFSKLIIRDFWTEESDPSCPFLEYRDSSLPSNSNSSRHSGDLTPLSTTNHLEQHNHRNGRKNESRASNPTLGHLGTW